MKRYLERVVTQYGAVQVFHALEQIWVLLHWPR